MKTVIMRENMVNRISLLLLLLISLSLVNNAFGQRRPRRATKTATPKATTPPPATQASVPTARSTAAEILPAFPRNLPPPPPIPQPKMPEGPTPEEDIIRTTSALVVVPVSVTNTRGEPVQGLTASDFRLEEENRVQQIDRVGDPDQVPIELVILLDISSSTKDRFMFQQQAASSFIRQVLKSTDRATVYTIGSAPKLIQARASANEAANKVVSIQTSVVKEMTAFFETVAEAAKYLKNSTPGHHRRVILAITDGENTVPEKFNSVTAILPDVQRSDTLFYSINPSGQALYLNKISIRGQQGLESLATTTGGAAFIIDKDEELPTIFNQIAAELRSQYLLQYYPKNEAADGAFLKIKVGVPKQPTLRIRARQGYYSKK
jgi:Ca-activated chloride channel homolog